MLENQKSELKSLSIILKEVLGQEKFKRVDFSEEYLNRLLNFSKKKKSLNILEKDFWKNIFRDFPNLISHINY